MLLVPLLCGTGRAAETGDVDGDGRISIADVWHYCKDTPAAPGSLDAFAGYPCAEGPQGDLYWSSMVPLMIYLESLSRSVEGSLAPWVGVWPRKVTSEPLPEDRRVYVDLGSSVAGGAGSDRVLLRITFGTEVPVEAFSLVFESDGGVLRVPELPPEARPPWSEGDWRSLSWAMSGSRWEQPVSSLPVSVPVPAYLATGGKYVVSYALRPYRMRSPWTLSPGLVEFAVEGRLPLGAQAGSYKVRLVRGSEVFLTDGTVVAPTALGEGEIVLVNEVTAGRDEGPVPLELDVENRRVLGMVEFRLVDREGRPAEEGKPLVEVARGEEFVLRVQMRTEVPLNYIHHVVTWPVGTLECGGADGLTNGDGNLFRNPEDRRLYEHGIFGCLSQSPWPHRLTTQFYLAAHLTTPESTYPGRLTEYFKPLGEWVNLREFRLRVPERAEAGEVPLVFQAANSGPGAIFIPYGEAHSFCSEELEPGRDTWSYDHRFQDAVVRVLADEPPPPPPPPPDLAIVVRVGDASGHPGELVEVPVFARADSAVSLLRVALAVESELVDVERVVVEILSRRTGDFHRYEVSRSEVASLHECEYEDNRPIDCVWGVPGVTRFLESEADAAIVDILPSMDAPLDYPGEELVEVVKLGVRIREEASKPEALLSPARVTYLQEGFEVEGESGGFLPWPDMEQFAPASETVAGRITILGGGLIRGDSNGDGDVNVSDAIATLNYLFLGGAAPGCLDGADTDDSGTVEITDAILLLWALFLGQAEIPPPYPDCDADPTADDLDCRRWTCPVGGGAGSRSRK
jgi:hypothetical protein